MTESSMRWWQNWSKTHAYVAEKMFYPTSVAEIVEAVQAAEAALRPLRAVGGGWSFTDASLPGLVETNRPNVYGVEALSVLSSKVTSFPTDPAQPSIASTAITAPALVVSDQPGSMAMFDGGGNQIDGTWIYQGNGVWLETVGQGRLVGGAGDPDFLERLGQTNLRPVHAIPPASTVQKSDIAGSMIMVDIAADPANASPDWFYRGGGIWFYSLAGRASLRTPFEGSLPDFRSEGRLSDPQNRINLSPRAALPAESLSVLLVQQSATPAVTEPVFLINTRSLVSSLQQQLPGLLSQSAAAATSDSLPLATRRFLFHVEGGITIAELGRLLAHQSPRLSLQAISGSPGATLAGALATGTHGAEFNWPLVTDRVKAVHLIGPGGFQWWIEGAESIVDPGKIRAAYPSIAAERIISGTTPIDGFLPQDWLGAAVVSLGSLGVVYSLIIEVVPQFGVREVVIQKKWGELPLQLPGLNVLELARLLRSPADTKGVSAKIVKLLQAGNLSGTGIPQADVQGNLINQYADLAINPNRRADGDYDCWIGNRQVTAKVPIDSRPPATGELEEIGKGLGAAFETPGMWEKVAKVFGLALPSIASIFEPVPLGTSIISNAVAVAGIIQRIKRMWNASDKIDVALDAVLAPMSGPPPGPEVAQALLSGLLAGLLGTANPDLRSDKTGVNVGALGFPESGVLGTAIEIALSPDDAFGFIQQEILDHIDPQKPFLGYVSIRLCSKTSTLMGMQQFGIAANQTSVMIEVVAYANPDCRAFMRGLQQRTVDRILAGTLDAMLHWGLENELMTWQHLRKMKGLQQHGVSQMSKLGTFKAIRARLHAESPASFRAFDNRFTERLGLSTQALAFLNATGMVIRRFVPTPLLAPAGSPLITGSRGYLQDLNLLNQLDHSVEVTDVRFIMDTPGTTFFIANPSFVIGSNQRTAVVIEYMAGLTPAPVTGLVEVRCDDPIDSIVRIRFSTTVAASRHAELTFTPVSVDFGTALVGASVERIIDLTNIGPFRAALAMEVTPVQQPPFSFQPPTTLDGGKSAALKVRYEPAARGEASFSLGIDLESGTDVTGVTYRHRYEIPLTGKAVAPVIFLAAGPLPPAGSPRPPRPERELRLLDFQTANSNQTTTVSFWIRNRGDAQLNVKGVESLDRGNFDITNPSPFPAVLPPGGELEVPCHFLAPAVPGLTLHRILKIYSDDPLRNSVELAVQGKVSGPTLTRLDSAGQPVAGEALDLGVVQASSSFNIVFRSDGTVPVELRSVTMPPNPGFSLSGSVPPIPAKLAPGQTLTVTVSLAALQGKYRGQIVLDYGVRSIFLELSATVA